MELMELLWSSIGMMRVEGEGHALGEAMRGWIFPA
jgi:hypothetical protein